MPFTSPFPVVDGGTSVGSDPITGSSTVSVPPQSPEPEALGEGLRLRFSALAGLTAPGLLDSPFYFQVPPLENFSRQMGYAHSEYDTLRSGQFSRPAGMQLRTWQFQTIFLDYEFSLAVYGEVPNPLEAADELEALLESGTPFKFYAGSPRLWGRSDFQQGSVPVTLRTLQVDERAGEVDCRYIDVSLSEFRRPAISGRGFGNSRGHIGSPYLPANLVVRLLPENRDTLYELARFYYGSASKWRVIAKVNGLDVPPSVSLREWYMRRKDKKLRIPTLPGGTRR